MRKYRQLHLWIGLICSVFILVESVTGLLLSEPWLMGSQQMEQRMPVAAAAANGSAANTAASESNIGGMAATEANPTAKGDNGQASGAQAQNGQAPGMKRGAEGEVTAW
ncbi:PepSY domain-containing protein [Paenibacillus sp. P26]|nr:PepSY domain-containing protein [Paenibacillus sp. P26]UUZ95754.1 PepSY domain-containing protein [Paenibacillus sp. P25]